MAKKESEWTYDEALAVAEGTVAALLPHCERIEIAGSLRRRRPVVHDIDLVVQPREASALALSMALGFAQVVSQGPKIWQLEVQGISVDVYLAGPEQFATLLLIRTGSAQHNVMLASLARAKGLHLKASGDGLFRGEERVAWRSEEEIFEALGLQYVQPEAREVS